MADQEAITFEVDPRQVIDAVAKANTAIGDYEKKTGASADRIRGSFEKLANFLIQYNDKSRASMERMVQTIEKQAAVYGRTGVERLIAQRDQVIKKLGDEQAAIDRVTAAYAKMIAAEERSHAPAGGLGAGYRAGLGARDLFEGRNAYGVVEFGRGILELSGVVAVLGAIGGGLAAVGAAGFEAAKGLAEYGLRIRDTELRTGLTAKEVGQFDFAMKAVGEDIGLTDRLMRGLTQALAETGAEGQKAREALRGLGVAPRDLQGEIRPTAELLLEISEAANKIPNALERNKALMDIFKRVGVEAAPAVLELAHNVERAKELGLGPEEKDIQRFVQYQQKLTEVSELWAKFTREVKDALAGPTAAVLGVLVNEPRPIPFHSNALEPRFNASGQMNAALKFLDQRGLDAENANAARGLGSYLSSGLEGAQAQLARLKKAYEDARGAAQQIADSGKVLPQVAAQHRTEVERAYEAYKRQSDVVKELTKDEEKRVSALEKARDLIRQGQSFYSFETGAGTQFVTGEQLAKANQIRRVPSLFPGGISPEQQILNNQRLSAALTATLPSGLQNVNGEVAFVSPEAARGVLKDSGLEAMRGFEQQQQQSRAIRLSATQAEANAVMRILELRSGPGGEIETARLVAGVRQQALQEEFTQTGDIIKFRESSLQNELDVELKIAEVRKRQHEEIARTAEGLAHTLFTNPGGFGRQLSTTVRDAALRPIERGIGNLTASFLQPLIFGNSAQDPVKVSTDLNTQATVANTAALYAHANALVSSASSTNLAPGGFSGFGNISGGGASSFPGFGSSPLGGFSNLASIVGGPGGTSGFAGPVGGFGGILGIGGGSTNGGGLAGIFRNLGGTGANLGKMIGYQGGGWWQLPGGVQTSVPGVGGIAESIASSPAAGTAGTLLAMNGLLGGNRGSVAGMFEGAAGGALIGMGIGGPLGAAIGAGVGFAVGLGELIAGVEPQWKEAERLVKQTYGIAIDRRTGQQIADIANQKYAGHVSIAVRDPDVRKMLQLYADSTGQKSSLFLDVVHSASLIETGGRLNQGLSYYNGAGYSYASAAGLPTLGPSAGVIPTGNPFYGGGPVVVSLDANQTVDLWRTGTTAAIAGDPRSIAAASLSGNQFGGSRLPSAGMLLAPSAITA